MLPRLPRIFLRVGRDRAPAVEAPPSCPTCGGAPGFLALTRVELTARHEHDGAESAPFVYDVVARRALDAVVIAAHFVGADGRRHVWLRSALRPPIALRTGAPFDAGGLWELPAGLVEPGEAPRAAAARELEEELGIAVEEDRMELLGAWLWPVPAMIAEQHHFFHVRVDGLAQAAAGGDGSALEAGAALVAVALDDALAACRTGELRDEKTELALRRLAEVPP